MEEQNCRLRIKSRNLVNVLHPFYWLLRTDVWGISPELLRVWRNQVNYTFKVVILKHIIGIDVAKAELAIYLNEKFINIENTTTAIKKWLKKQIKNIEIDMVVMEPTGGYERTLVNCLENTNIPYRLVHANHVRAFAKSKGSLAKTDNIDAKMLADFASTMKISPKSAIHPHPELKDIVDRRDQLVEIRVQESNRLDAALNRASIKSIKKHIKFIDKEIEELENYAYKFIENNSELKFIVELYKSIPGIGLLTAIRLIVDLPELSSYGDKQLAALVGVAPMNKDSGKHRGKRTIKGGRPKLRSVLYLCALSGIRFNPVLKRFYQRLKLKGKPSKVAIIAVVRKLLTIIRSVCQRRAPWVLDF